MKLHRLNLALSEGDFAVVRRIANYNRVAVGTWARSIVVSQAVKAVREATADGSLSEFEQLELFDHKRKQRGR